MLDDLRKVIYLVSSFALAGVVTLTLQAIHTRSWATGTTSVLWALSCLASGGLTGFLFGIPRTLQSDRPVQATAIGYRQHVNTNLEQISDWLTKIIVGVGLIQMGAIARHLKLLAETLAAGMGGVEQHFAFALALIAYFVVIGFLSGYLSTRLFLAPAFSRADRATEVVQEVRSLAAYTSGDALKQVLLKAKPETFITGEPSFQEEPTSGPDDTVDEDDEEVEEDPNEPAELDAHLERLKRAK